MPKSEKLDNTINEDHFNTEDKLPLKTSLNKINKTDSTTSLDTKSSNSSDGDWEKISDNLDK